MCSATRRRHVPRSGFKYKFVSLGLGDFQQGLTWKAPRAVEKLGCAMHKLHLDDSRNQEYEIVLDELPDIEERDV